MLYNGAPFPHLCRWRWGPVYRHLLPSWAGSFIALRTFAGVRWMKGEGRGKRGQGVHSKHGKDAHLILFLNINSYPGSEALFTHTHSHTHTHTHTLIYIPNLSTIIEFEFASYSAMCSSAHLLPYSYVQHHYWDVGLLRYWRISQVRGIFYLRCTPISHYRRRKGKKGEKARKREKQVCFMVFLHLPSSSSLCRCPTSCWLFPSYSLLQSPCFT